MRPKCQSINTFCFQTCAQPLNTSGSESHSRKRRATDNSKGRECLTTPKRIDSRWVLGRSARDVLVLLQSKRAPLSQRILSHERMSRMETRILQKDRETRRFRDVNREVRHKSHGQTKPKMMMMIRFKAGASATDSDTPCLVSACFLME